MNDLVQINAPIGPTTAYISRPRITPAPAIVVIHEVFGVNADMRQTCDELAAQGYLAVCPDLFWRLEPGVELTDQTEADLGKALVLYNAFDVEAGVTDIAATINAVRKMEGCSGKVGVVGYCLGGLLTFMTASRPEPDVAIAYYPGNADKHLDQASSASGPLMVHLAVNDEYIPQEAQDAIQRALRGLPEVEVYTYAGCGHAFARHRGTAYNAQAAALANRRTSDFLALHLRST